MTPVSTISSSARSSAWGGVELGLLGLEDERLDVGVRGEVAGAALLGAADRRRGLRATTPVEAGQPAPRERFTPDEIREMAFAFWPEDSDGAIGGRSIR